MSRLYHIHIVGTVTDSHGNQGRSDLATKELTDEFNGFSFLLGRGSVDNDSLTLLEDKSYII